MEKKKRREEGKERKGYIQGMGMTIFLSLSRIVGYLNHILVASVAFLLCV